MAQQGAVAVVVGVGPGTGAALARRFAKGYRVALVARSTDYLKTLAVSRLYLDNIDHIQSSWLTPGIKVCQVGLQFGADDVGSILIEENVVFAAGVKNRTNESELRRVISDAGFIPAQRDTLYRSYALK